MENKFKVKNKTYVDHVEIIDSDYNDTQTIGNKKVYAMDGEENCISASLRMKDFFSPVELGRIKKELETLPK